LKIRPEQVDGGKARSGMEKVPRAVPGRARHPLGLLRDRGKLGAVGEGIKQDVYTSE